MSWIAFWFMLAFIPLINPKDDREKDEASLFGALVFWILASVMFGRLWHQLITALSN